MQAGDRTLAFGRTGGLGIGTLIILGIIAYAVLAPGGFKLPGMNGGGTSLEGPLNLTLQDAFTGANIDGEGVEVYKPGSNVPFDSWDVDVDTASDSSQNFKSGDQYFFIVCEGTAAQVTGVGCEGTDGGTREFGAADAVRGVSVTIPFATSSDSTQHNIVISLVASTDDGTGEDVTWTASCGSTALTDNDGSVTDNDFVPDGGVGTSVDTCISTTSYVVTVNMASTNDNTGFNEPFTFPDSGRSVDPLHLYARLRQENGTGAAQIISGASLIWSGTNDRIYDLGSLSDCVDRKVIGTTVEKQGVCTFSFTIENGAYTAANTNTQIGLYGVQYGASSFITAAGALNSEAFLDGATTDLMFDFFTEDS